MWFSLQIPLLLCLYPTSALCCVYMAAQPPTGSDLHSPLSAYCCRSTRCWMRMKLFPVTWVVYLLEGWFGSLTFAGLSTLDPVNTAHVCAPTELIGCYESNHTRAWLWSWLIVSCLSVKILAEFFSATKQLLTNVSVIQPSIMCAYQRKSSPINNYCQLCAVRQLLCSIHSWCSSSQIVYFECQLDAPLIMGNTYQRKKSYSQSSLWSSCKVARIFNFILVFARPTLFSVALFFHGSMHGLGWFFHPWVWGSILSSRMLMHVTKAARDILALADSFLGMLARKYFQFL